jgi:hypothetical protein
VAAQQDRAAVVDLAAVRDRLHLEQRGPVAQPGDGRKEALRVALHEQEAAARRQTLGEAVGASRRALAPAEIPARLRRVAHVGEGVGALGRHRRQREERAVHHGHAKAGELGRRVDQADLRQLRLDVEPRQPAGGQQPVRPGVGDEEDAAGAHRPAAVGLDDA